MRLKIDFSENRSEARKADCVRWVGVRWLFENGMAFSGREKTSQKTKI